MGSVVKLTEAGKKHQAELNKKYINKIGKPCVRCKEVVTEEKIFGMFDCENCVDWANAVHFSATDLRSTVRLILLRESNDVKDITKFVMGLIREQLNDLLIQKGYMKKVGKTNYFIEEGV